MSLRTVKIFSFVSILCCAFLSNCSGSNSLSEPAPVERDNSNPVLTETAAPVSNDAEVIQVENLDRLTMVDRWGLGDIKSTALSPDEETLAVAVTSGVVLYDVKTMEVKQLIDLPILKKMEQDFSPPRVVAFSSDGSLLAVAYHDIMVWDLKKNEVYYWIKNRIADFSVNQMAFSPEDDVLLVKSGGASYAMCGDYGGNYALYDLSSHGAVLFNDYYCPGVDNRFTFTNDGNVVIAGLVDGESSGRYFKTAVIEVKTGKQLKELVFLDGKRPLSVSPDGSKIAIIPNYYPDITEKPIDDLKKTEITDMDSQEMLDQIKGIVLFLPDDNYLIINDDSWEIKTSDHQMVCSFDQIPQIELENRFEYSFYKNHLYFRKYWENRIEVWDTSSCRISKQISIPNEGYDSLKFSTDGKTMAVSDSNYLYVRDPISAENRFSISGDDALLPGWCYALSADGQTLVTIIENSSFTYTLSLWNTATGEKVKSIPTSLSSHYDVDVSADGSIVAIPNSEGAYLWDAESGAFLTSVPGWFWEVHFNPAGGNFALVEGEEIVFRNDHSGEIERSFNVGKEMFDIVFTHDWLSLAVVKDDEIDLWDIAGNKIGDLKGYPPIVPNAEYKTSATYYDVKFSPDNRLLAAIRYDSQTYRLLFWDTATGKIVRDVEFPYIIYRMEFTPDGKRLILLGDSLAYVMALDEGE